MGTEQVAEQGRQEIALAQLRGGGGHRIGPTAAGRRVGTRLDLAVSGA
jgi:hypothetical protein